MVRTHPPDVALALRIGPTHPSIPRTHGVSPFARHTPEASETALLPPPLRGAAAMTTDYEVGCLDLLGNPRAAVSRFLREAMAVTALIKTQRPPVSPPCVTDEGSDCFTIHVAQIVRGAVPMHYIVGRGPLGNPVAWLIKAASEAIAPRHARIDIGPDAKTLRVTPLDPQVPTTIRHRDWAEPIVLQAKGDTAALPFRDYTIMIEPVRITVEMTNDEGTIVLPMRVVEAIAQRHNVAIGITRIQDDLTITLTARDAPPPGVGALQITFPANVAVDTVRKSLRAIVRSLGPFLRRGEGPTPDIHVVFASTAEIDHIGETWRIPRQPSTNGLVFLSRKESDSFSAHSAPHDRFDPRHPAAIGASTDGDFALPQARVPIVYVYIPFDRSPIRLAALARLLSALRTKVRPALPAGSMNSGSSDRPLR
ncbi:MAG: hypothetical protein HY543_07745 [Deltaproteobacteria bacterium]|nr:hypothetical protein [Deltaproteobacteria bacterium]